jgi:hypothetical protein
MPPRMFCAGSAAFRTPKRRAVSGISCISPCAFFGDSAFGSKLDSCAMTASTTCGLQLVVRRHQLDEAHDLRRRMGRRRGGGSSAGSGCRGWRGWGGRPASTAVVAPAAAGRCRVGAGRAGARPAACPACAASCSAPAPCPARPRPANRCAAWASSRSMPRAVGQHPGQAVLRLGVTKARGAAVQLAARAGSRGSHLFSPCSPPPAPAPPGASAAPATAPPCGSGTAPGAA